MGFLCLTVSDCYLGLLLLTVLTSCMCMDLQLLTVLGGIIVLLLGWFGTFAPTAAANDAKAREGAGEEQYTCHSYHISDQVFVGPGEVYVD